MQDLHKWIKSVIDTTQGLTQKGLAKAMGLNPAAVNRMLHGARAIKVDEVPVIEEYLGQNWIPHDREKKSMGGAYTPAGDIYGADNNGGFSQARRFERSLPVPHADVVPVYGLAESSSDDITLDRTKPVDWVPRHPSQAGLEGAYAFYIHSDDMQPRYFPGELVYLHPARPPERNRDCLVVFHDGRAVVRTFVRRDGKNIVLRQYNLPHEETIASDDIATLFTVVGRS